MTTETTIFDPADFLDDADALAGYLSEAMLSGDARFVADALGVIARAKGMSKVASEAGMSRESLYRALSPKGNPEFATVLGVLKSLGFRLQVFAA